MQYAFVCDECDKRIILHAKAFSPPPAPLCCNERARRLYNCHVDTSGCKDHDFIPEKDRIACGPLDRNLSAAQAEAIEARYQRGIEETRKQASDGGNKASFKLTNQIPAELFHGKIKQTGDRNYWDDPKNRARHKSTKVT